MENQSQTEASKQEQETIRTVLQATSTATTLSAGAVSWDGRHILCKFCKQPRRVNWGKMKTKIASNRAG